MKETRFEMLKKHNAAEFEKSVKEGKADEKMVSLCGFINSLQNFFSSSSCAGRIMLLKTDASESKRKAAFQAKWHRKVQFSELVEKLEKKNSAQELWFKQEPFILHFGARNLENANKILECCRLAGIKRAGIMVAEQEKFLLEIIGTQNISLPVKKKNKLLVEKDFLNFLLEKANAKLEKNYLQLKKFEKILKQEIK